MRNLLLIPRLSLLNRQLSTTKFILANNPIVRFQETQIQKNQTLFTPSKKLSLFEPHQTMGSIKFRSIPYRRIATESQKEAEATSAKDAKKPSKFSLFYKQYGPMFIVVHLITVVLWIYGFFSFPSRYDITQLLNVFHKVGIMSEESVKNIHYKIDNYKTESGWITGTNIKHFATAYMVYKVIAPFRYMVSIALVRQIVKVLRSKGIMKA